MGRRPRVHVPGGIYYVVLLGNQQPIFLAEADRQQFGAILAQVLQRCRARVHAYGWTEREARMIVQVTDVPLGRFVQRLCSRYARAVHQRGRGGGNVFQHPYRAALVHEHSHLLPLVRRIHLWPVSLMLAEHRDGYVWTSHRAYLGLEHCPWLTTCRVLGGLGRNRRQQSEGYGVLMQADLSQPWVPREIEHAIARPGDDLLLRWLARQRPVVHGPAVISVEQLIDAVARRLHVDVVALRSRSRRRELVLARAVIGWYATTHQIATLTQIAHALDRSPSSIWMATERYRLLRPDLFGWSLHQLLTGTEAVSGRAE